MDALPIADGFSALRRHMVQKQLRERGITDERVLAAMERVPRHEFIPLEKRQHAYDDHPVVIGEGQTISQPFMVASMVQAAEIKPTDVVVEIGTGSGYQSAILAELAGKVYSVERFASLAESARAVLERLHYNNVVIAVGDGSTGFPAQDAPMTFDAIIVSAAAPGIPASLAQQLKEGGRMVIPIGTLDEQLLHVVRRQQGFLVDQRLYGCKFVPLVGTQGFQPR